jgi:hypothetical protein
MSFLNQAAKVIIPKKETSGTSFASLNRKWEYRMQKKTIPPLAANYFGTGADGDVTISTDTSLTSTEDGDMIVKNYNSLTIDSSKTLTVANRCRGLLIFCKGNLTVNGTLTMTARGCKANPATSGTDSDTPVAPGDGHGVGANGIRFPFLTASDTDTLSAAEFEGCGTALYNLISSFPSLSGNGKIITIARTGASGGAGIVGSKAPGNNGSAGSAGQSGGGGSGGHMTTTGGSADGGNGTCFSGGSGSGGCGNTTAPAVSDYGGAGGNGEGSTYNAGGGAGNPGGTKQIPAAFDGENGTGGLLIIICGGSITVGASGLISANGKNGGGGTEGDGAGSGGGNIVLVHVSGYTNSGTVQASGGLGATASNAGNNVQGGNGGAGSIQTLQVNA